VKFVLINCVRKKETGQFKLDRIFSLHGIHSDHFDFTGKIGLVLILNSACMLMSVMLSFVNYGCNYVCMFELVFTYVQLLAVLFPDSNMCCNDVLPGNNY